MADRRVVNPDPSTPQSLVENTLGSNPAAGRVTPEVSVSDSEKSVLFVNDALSDLFRRQEIINSEIKQQPKSTVSTTAAAAAVAVVAAVATTAATSPARSNDSLEVNISNTSMSSSGIVQPEKCIEWRDIPKIHGLPCFTRYLLPVKEVEEIPLYEFSPIESLHT